MFRVYAPEGLGLDPWKMREQGSVSYMLRGERGSSRAEQILALR